MYAGTGNTNEDNERTITSIGHPEEKDVVCQNGKVVHRRCQQVYRASECHHTVCNLGVTRGSTRQTGDSGGPVYSTSKALGIHHARDDFDGERRDFFSRTDRLFDALELYISTSSS